MDRGACLYEGVEAAKVLDKWALSVAIGGKTGIIFRIGLAGVPPEWRTGHETIWTGFADCAGSAGCARPGAGAAVVLRLDTRAKEQHEMLSRAILARETWLFRHARTLAGKRRGAPEAIRWRTSVSRNPRVRTSPWDSRRLTFCRRRNLKRSVFANGSRGVLEGAGSAQNVTLDAASLDTAKPEADANRVERTAPQDARVSFEDGKFTLQAETGGNTL